MSLTLKQEKFVAAYIETGNASEAVRRAYDTSRMKTETINRRAFDLLHNSKIAARIAEYVDRQGVTAEKTLKRLLDGQEFDFRRLYHEDGSLKKPHELDDETARAVVGTKHDATTGQLVEYKIIDVKGCAELLGKHLKLFTDRQEVEHTGDLTFNMVVQKAGGQEGTEPGSGSSLRS